MKKKGRETETKTEKKKSERRKYKETKKDKNEKRQNRFTFGLHNVVTLSKSYTNVIWIWILDKDSICND